MLTVVITLILIGVLLYLVNVYVPMDAKIKNILNWFVSICVVLWLLNLFGVFGYLGNQSVPRIHS